ncbi:hypothetical protein L7F22_011069 [Adiantum nelumboides]|nr:hypothetical protein [Adiantum nelumboides]
MAAVFKCRRSEWLGRLLKTYNSSSCAPLPSATRFCGTAAATETKGQAEEIALLKVQVAEMSAVFALPQVKDLLKTLAKGKEKGKEQGKEHDVNAHGVTEEGEPSKKPWDEDISELSSPSYSPQTSFSSSSDSSSSSSPRRRNGRVFVSHTFYKGKGALSFRPGYPTFKVSEDGTLVLEKQGNMFLAFAPALGPRNYDWAQKQIMALSVDEMGSLIALTMSESIEFFHDPHLASSNSGKIRKTLRVEPMSDKNGYFFNFDMANNENNVNLRLTVPVTKGEFTVIRSSFSFAMPYLMGWHSFANPSAAKQLRNIQANPNSEWSK